MKITPKYYPEGKFTNFLFTPETQAEQDALIKIALRNKEISDMNDYVKELEKELFEKGTL